MRLILNADDLGMDLQTNDLVFDMMDSGYITSATIMANCPACADAVARHRGYPRCSFGIHLNLTSGRPLTMGHGLESLLRDDGSFAGLEVLISARRSMALFRAMYTELAAQVERLQSLGLNISHIDSHQHIHNLPALFGIVKFLQKKYGIRRIRPSKNLYGPDDTQPVRYIKKMVYNLCLQYVYRSFCPDLFTDFATFVHVGANRIPRAGVLECMVHLREQEEGWSDYRMLSTDWQGRLELPVELVSYWHLNSVMEKRL